MARPTSFTKSRATAICRRIADGESLRTICQSKGMPSRHTVFNWLAANEEFRTQYAVAREMQADLLADEIIEIADDARGDAFVDKDGNEQTNNERVARSKVKIDARKWLAGKLRPKVYGDRVVQELTGEGGGPIQTEAAVTIYIPSNGRDG